MTSGIPTVFVVDDDASVRRGLQRLLRSAGFTAETFASAPEFLERHDRNAAGCVILDLAMPGFDGLQLQRALTDRDSVLPIIFLTGHGDIPTSVKAMKGGAVDFLTKPATDDGLLAAVRMAMERCEALHRAREEIATIRRRVETLTPRERDVFKHLLSGKLNKQIAADLGTVEHTIKVHRARVMQKMQARTLAALVRLAERAGIEATPPTAS